MVPGPARNGLGHLGFDQALASVYPEVRDTVKEFRTTDQTLWFTGHSLGGALAMLAGSRMYFEDPKLLPNGVYTFGQPRTCDRLLARAYDSAFKSRTFRFVNNNDIVAQAPPEPVYHHVKAMMYFDANGRLHEEMSFASGLTDRFKGLTADMFAPGTDGIRDHSMDRYFGEPGEESRLISACTISAGDDDVEPDTADQSPSTLPVAGAVWVMAVRQHADAAWEYCQRHPD